MPTVQLNHSQDDTSTIGFAMERLGVTGSPATPEIDGESMMRWTSHFISPDLFRARTVSGNVPYHVRLPVLSGETGVESHDASVDEIPLVSEWARRDQCSSLDSLLLSMRLFPASKAGTAKSVCCDEDVLDERGEEPCALRIQTRYLHDSSFTEDLVVPEIDNAVAPFVEAKGVGRTLDAALRIVRSCFPGLMRLSVSVESDPELQDWDHVRLNARVRGEIDQVLDWENDFYTELGRNVEGQEQDLFTLTVNLED